MPPPKIPETTRMDSALAGVAIASAKNARSAPRRTVQKTSFEPFIWFCPLFPFVCRFRRGRRLRGSLALPDLERPRGRLPFLRRERQRLEARSRAGTKTGKQGNAEALIRGFRVFPRRARR